jgi:hypothetical protein
MIIILISLNGNYLIFGSCCFLNTIYNSFQYKHVHVSKKHTLEISDPVDSEKIIAFGESMYARRVEYLKRVLTSARELVIVRSKPINNLDYSNLISMLKRKYTNIEKFHFVIISMDKVEKLFYSPNDLVFIFKEKIDVDRYYNDGDYATSVRHAFSNQMMNHVINGIDLNVGNILRLS